MAKAHGKKAKVYVTGLDISSFLKSASSGGDQDLADASGLGDNDKTFLVGLQSGKASLDGMYSAKGKEAGEASQITDVLEAAFGVGPINITHLPQGDGFGTRANMLMGNQSSVEISTPYTDLVKISGDVQSNVGFNVGFTLHENKQEAAGGNGEPIDNGAAIIKTEHGGMGMLQVFAVEAGKTATVKIQHSADNVTFVDLITFGAVTAGEKAEAVVLPQSTEVKRYIRVLWTATGKATFHAAFCRNP